jgi:pre-mRNA cleavage complex 2 protein Pcf11
LYNPQDLQCRTCARRFPNTEDGRSKRDAHLDWHFRINKKLRENVGRGQTRAWYLTEEVFVAPAHITNFSQEWIKNREEDSSIIPTTQTSQVKESTPQPDASIPAPTGVLADQPCPICKEKFHSEWDEDKEDWVWKNAIKVGGKIYHASCFAETRGKVGAAGDRSKTASRSGTPQPSESLASILGKRKGISNNPEALKVPRLTE